MASTNGKDRAMPIDHRRHLISRPSVRATILASALGVAVFGMSAETADAATRSSGFGGMRATPMRVSTINKAPTFRIPARTTKPNLATSRRIGTRISRLPPGNGDRPPRHHPPRWPHKPPIIVGLPTLPAGPAAPVDVSTPPPSPPSGGGGAGGGGGGAPAAVAAVNGNFVPDEVLVRFNTAA